MTIRPVVALGGLLLALATNLAPAAVRPVLDGDADGVRDDRDACPYTPIGISVGPDGCSTPGDEDEDGIPDVADACPLSPAGSFVDAQGCALDEDVDGVADGVDRCPNSPLGSLVIANGCAPGQVPQPGLARRAPVVPARPAGVAPVARAPAPYVAPTPAPTPAPVPAPVAIAPVTPPPAAVSRPAPVIPTPPVAVAVRPAAPAPAPSPVPAPAVLPTPPLPPIATPAPVAAAPAVVAAAPAVTPVPIASPSAAPVLPAATVRAEPDRTFYFDETESKLSWAAERAIKQSARDFLPELEKNPAASLVLSGHADTKSDGQLAPRIATARAQAVREALIANGVPAPRISVRVPGVAEPRFFGASLARNCRVELRLVGQQAGGMTVAAAVPVVAAPVAAVPAPPVAAPAAAPAVAAPVAAVKAPIPPVAAAPTTAPAAPPVAPPPLPGPAPAPVARVVAAASVNFAPYSAMLDNTAMKSLDAFVHDGTRALLADTTANVTIVSGIDAAETGPAAMRLAESRAATIRVYLASIGFPRNRVDVSTQAQTGTRRADLNITR